MAKKSWERLFLVILVVFLVVSGCSLAEAWSGEQTMYFTLIGGDGDSLGAYNNLFSQNIFAKNVVKNFIKNKTDYSNQFAQKLANQASSYNHNIKDNDAIIAVGAFSHGGQALYFMDLSNVDEVFMFDACAKIIKMCDNPQKCNTVWTQKVLDIACQGINIHIYASGDTNDISAASRLVINSLKDYATYEAVTPNGAHLEWVSSNYIQVYDANHHAQGKIYVEIVGGKHGAVCVTAASSVEAYIQKP